MKNKLYLTPNEKILQEEFVYKHDIDKEKCYNKIKNAISNIEHIGMLIEQNNNKIKFTILIDDKRILIIDKDSDTSNDDVIFSYFMNRQLIIADVINIHTLCNNFNLALNNINE